MSEGGMEDFNRALNDAKQISGVFKSVLKAADVLAAAQNAVETQKDREARIKELDEGLEQKRQEIQRLEGQRKRLAEQADQDLAEARKRHRAAVQAMEQEADEAKARIQAEHDKRLGEMKEEIQRYLRAHHRAEAEAKRTEERAEAAKAALAQIREELGDSD